jgi:transposase
MAVDKKRQLKPGPAGKTAERAHYIRLMKQGFNNSEACRIVGVGRKTGSHWGNGRTVRDPATGRTRSYAAITMVREQPAVISARYLSEEERITIADRHRCGESLRSIAAGLGRSPSTVSLNFAGTAIRRDNTARTTPRRRPGPGVSDHGRERSLGCLNGRPTSRQCWTAGGAPA